MGRHKKLRKAIYLLQDGISGRPREELDGRTELEIANTPNFDKLAKEGICGVMDPMASGIRVGTDVGHLALFGYNPLKVYDGRGPIEAAGIDFELEEGDLALRGNFATVDEDMMIVDRRAGRIREGTQELAFSLNGMRLNHKVKVYFKEATEHRAVVIFRGDRFSSYITSVDPGAGNEGVKLPSCKAKDEAFSIAVYTASLINQFTLKSYKILKEHPVNLQRRRQNKPPANIILTRGAGTEIRIKSITDKFNIKGTCISGESTIRGIAKLAGFEVIHHPEFTANIDTDLYKKANCALEALTHSELVVIHTKGTDIMSHDDRVEDKIKFIEKTDNMMGYLMDNLPRDVICYIALAGDHSTPSNLRTHSGDPVPVVLYGPDVLKDDISVYGERSCAKGGLNRISANEFLLCILDYINATYRFGA